MIIFISKDFWLVMCVHELIDPYITQFSFYIKKLTNHYSRHIHCVLYIVPFCCYYAAIVYMLLYGL